MDRIFAVIGACSAFLAVCAGAFATHGLRDRIAPEMLAVFETGARYQMYHALGLFVVAWFCDRFNSPLPVAAGWLFIVGTVIFSGSLYTLAVTGLGGFGAVTPVGGLAFLAGWALLAWVAWQRP